MHKKITVGFVMMALATSVFAAANEDAEFVTPEELGWEAGVVAPSPLEPDFVDPEFKTLAEAEKAKAIGEAELKRIQRLREGHTYLCQKKVFVNDCIERAESVLYKRTRIANQLIRKADHQIRIFKSKERRSQAAQKPSMPAQRGSVKSNDEKIAKQSARQQQEQANVAAYEAKLKAQDERVAQLQKEAAERKAKREARKAAYEAERQKREQAQKLQKENSQKEGLF